MSVAGDGRHRMRLPRCLFDTPLLAFALVLVVPLIVALA
jgi:hypothetical protein